MYFTKPGCETSRTSEVLVINFSFSTAFVRVFDGNFGVSDIFLTQSSEFCSGKVAVKHAHV